MLYEKCKRGDTALLGVILHCSEVARSDSAPYERFCTRAGISYQIHILKTLKDRASFFRGGGIIRVKEILYLVDYTTPRVL